MAGESVILNHKKGEYYTLNEVGSKVWDMFKEGPQSIDDLVSEVMEDYDIEKNQCQADIEKLVHELLDEKLLEINS
jgi:BMFP domain-containing protein YqiC